MQDKTKKQCIDIKECDNCEFKDQCISDNNNKEFIQDLIREQQSVG